MKFQSTKVIELGSCAFRQPKANHSHCKFLHGYNLTAKFWFGANELDENNWVVDFGGLKGLKEKLKNQFDHTTCIAANDPVLPIFQQLEKYLLARQMTFLNQADKILLDFYLL